MKTKLFISIFFYALLALAQQNFRVTTFEGYSVLKPYLDVYNNEVYLTFSLNMRFFKFPLSGPSQPISNPVNPDPFQWGPSKTDIVVNPINGWIYILYYDYQQGVYYAKYSYSTDGGNNWNVVPLNVIQISSYLPGRPDLPRIIKSEKGNIYGFWYVFENDSDTSGIFMFKNSNLEIHKIDLGRARYEYGISAFAKTINNIDNIFVVYFRDSSYYFMKSTDEGNSFSTPLSIQSINIPFPQNDMKTQIFMDNQNSLYVTYSYINFDFQPGQFYQHLSYVIKSTDLGNSWSSPVLFDTNFYYSNIEITPDAKFVRLYLNDDGNLYVQSTRDFLIWSQPVRVNNVDSSVVEGFDDMGFFDRSIVGNKLYTAWIDKRLANQEIFYGYVDIPEVSSMVEYESLPSEFRLMQNYPNPFNPITSITLKIPSDEYITLEVFDILGNKIKTLFKGNLIAGIHEFQFDSEGLSSGVYFYQVRSSKFNDVKKMILSK